MSLQICLGFCFLITNTQLFFSPPQPKSPYGGIECSQSALNQKYFETAIKLVEHDFWIFETIIFKDPRKNLIEKVLEDKTYLSYFHFFNMLVVKMPTIMEEEIPNSLFSWVEIPSSGVAFMQV